AALPAPPASWPLLLGLGLLMAVIFLTDLLAPARLKFYPLYLVPLALARRLTPRPLAAGLLLLASGLTLVGGCLPLAVDLSSDLLNAGLFSGVLLIVGTWSLLRAPAPAAAPRPAAPASS